MSKCSAAIRWGPPLTLGTNNQTSTFFSPPIDRLYNVDQLLLVFQDPIELVVVAGSEITHHMLVPEEEHQGDGIVQFVHLLEVRDLV